MFGDYLLVPRAVAGKPVSSVAALVFLAVVLLAPTLRGREQPQVDALFEEGQRLMDTKNYSEALKKFQAALANSPDGTGSLYNGGLAAYLNGDFKTAAQLWERLAQVDPNDWEAQAKLIQAYQALGDEASRDRHRDRLFAMRRTKVSKELAKQDSYRRDQFEVSGRKVLVFENFELKGDRAVLYTFIITKQNNPEEDYHFSLGSYDVPNKAAHELCAIGRGDLLFLLDRYSRGGSHATFGFFKNAPPYETVRERVMKIMSEGVLPGSGFEPGSSKTPPLSEPTALPGRVVTPPSAPGGG